MEALRLTADWPVPHVAAAVMLPEGRVERVGDTAMVFRIASISKMLTGWATLIACEEGIVGLDDPCGQEGCTLRHLLAHAGGYPFDGAEPIARPGSRRIYSNTGIEMAARYVADAAGMSFQDYLREAVFEPLAMASTSLRTSPAHGVWSTVDDLCRFIAELHSPMLLSAESSTAFRTVQFAGLAGVIPGLGRYGDCPWGLGTEIRGDKQPHWTGTRNSPRTFGHFGGAGTLLWVDEGARVSCVALADRPFDEWSAEALRVWPQLADAVLAEATA